MPISKDEARELAKTFRDLSNQLGDFRFKNWSNLSAAQRQKIEDTEWTLLNYSSDFITTAVGIALDDLEADLKAIFDAMGKAKKVIATIDTVKDVLKVTACVIALGGAITSKRPSAIVSAAGDLLNTAKDVIDNA